MILSNVTAALLLLSSISDETLQLNISKPQAVNNTLVLEVMHSLHELHTFKNIVLYISEVLDLVNEPAAAFFDDFWHEFPIVPIIIVRNNQYDNPMDGFLSTPTLIIVFTTGHDDAIMQLAAESLTRIRIMKTLFILFPIMADDVINDDLFNYLQFEQLIEMTYEWIWHQQFINSAIITIRNNIFIHEPYPQPKVINLTNIWLPTSFFVDYTVDFKGYVVNTPIEYDLPRVFYKHMHRIGAQEKLLVSGTSAQIFSAFMETINATLNDTKGSAPGRMEALNLNKVLQHIEDKSLEVSINSYSAIAMPESGQSYPIGINDWCIMVPYRNGSPVHQYMTHIFRNSTWLLIACGFLYSSFAIWFCTSQRPRAISQVLIQALCALLSIAPTSILTASTGRHIRVLTFFLFVSGFVLSNMYISKMTSYLITSLQQKQIDTVEDVIEVNLRIMLFDYEYDKLLAMPSHYPERFLQQLLIVDKTIMDMHRDRMNTSYGYSIQTDRWNFLNMQQHDLRKPLFRLSKMCMGPFYHVFPMQDDSHFQMPFKYFFMYVSQSGFLEYWQQNAFSAALHFHYVRMMNTYEQNNPLPLRFYRYGFYIWWCGLALSTLVFMYEKQWLHMSKIRFCCNKIKLWLNK